MKIAILGSGYRVVSEDGEPLFQSTLHSTCQDFINSCPVEKIKGKMHGLCNRQACLSPNGITWYNSGTDAYYCEKCAKLINNPENFALLGYDLCTDMG